jgi:hypothetical protein
VDFCFDSARRLLVAQLPASTGGSRISARRCVSTGVAALALPAEPATSAISKATITTSGLVLTSLRREPGGLRCAANRPSSVSWSQSARPCADGNLPRTPRRHMLAHVETGK